ncbi:MAG: hypothetical protein J1G38_00150 [Clostridiales bacterium]|nr:hypothetical protein [Clostridiales bacterium]
MVKTIVLKCEKCGHDHTYYIGTPDMAMLQDAIDKIPERDADKLLDAVNRMLMNKTESQRTAFMMNNADTLSMVNYDVCGTSLSLFEIEDIKRAFATYNPQQIEKLNASMAMWEDAVRSEGFIAFDAIFYCRKCKKLTQGMFLKVRSIEDKKERVYLYTPKCKTCNSELALVNDANMGYLFEGLTARAPCPDCGGKLKVADVRFKPQ